MCKACEVGKIVVNKCLAQSIFINTQKLQKLLVLMQLEYVKRHKDVLYKEDIVIWDCGVAIKEVDIEFRSSAVRFSKEEQEYIPLREKEEECVDYVIDKFGHMTTIEIMNLEIIQKILPLAKKITSNGAPHINARILLEQYINDEN